MTLAQMVRPARGETISGDTILIMDGRITTIALADGLGHGEKASIASTAFCEFVEKHASDDIRTILERSSPAIASTRGVAAAIIRLDLDAGTLSFVGIGNIELQAVSRVPIRPVCSPGIVGRPLRSIKQFDYAVGRGDIVAVYSDGISSRFRLNDFKYLLPEQIADSVLDKHGKHHDDASIVVLKLS